MIGPTGDFPQGKLRDDDNGALSFRVGILENKIVVQFGVPVEWIGLDAPLARALAAKLIEKADLIEGQVA